MQDAVASIYNIEYRDACNCAGILRLPAGGWIERSLIEDNRAPIRPGIDDCRLDISQVAVVVVEPPGH
jgi:hypothetical protein